jgi:hypothetical protein
VTPAPDSHSHDHDDEDHAVTASTCVAHGDHWHCPSGVAEPSTAPAQSAAAGSGTGSAPAQSVAAAAGRVEGLGAVGIFVGVLGWIL